MMQLFRMLCLLWILILEKLGRAGQAEEFTFEW